MLKGSRLSEKLFGSLEQSLPHIRSGSSEGYSDRLFSGSAKFGAGKKSLHPGPERTSRLLVSEIRRFICRQSFGLNPGRPWLEPFAVKLVFRDRKIIRPCSSGED